MTATFPEVGSVSPGWYYGFSNYEDSFRPDWVDKHCAPFRQLHHKDEQGLLLLENIGDEVIKRSFSYYCMSTVVCDFRRDSMENLEC